MILASQARRKLVFFKKRHIFGSYYDRQRPINGRLLGQKRDLFTVSLTFNSKVNCDIIKLSRHILKRLN